jgi:diguanylate cyclase (GGDEF)-like protein/hemerythrin-like metal-binding protein/PAS domain S-box-containing protein
LQSIDIFPWHDNFNTGVSTIDQQHQRLVELLNILAGHVANQTDIPTLNVIFDELADYAVYHFQTEEAIWHEYLPEDAMEIQHGETHNGFINSVENLKEQTNNKSVNSVIEKVLSFLTLWLASHILETDRHMAMIVLAIEFGMSLKNAKKHAEKQMKGTTRVLIDIMLSTYNSHVTNTLQLMKEISERKQVEIELKAALEAQQITMVRIQSLMDSSFDAIITTDQKGKVIDWSHQAEVIFGYSKNKAMGRDVADLIVPDTHREAHRQGMNRFIKTGIPAIIGKRIEIQGMRSDGTEFPAELTISALLQNQEHVFCAYVRDITDRKRTEETLYKLAFYDPLTNLPNRRLLHDRLHQILLLSTRQNLYGAILQINLNKFKFLNDTKGHYFGDLLLKEVAERLQTIIHTDDTIARIGGDEFVVVLNSLSDNVDQSAIQAQKIAERVRDAIIQPFDLQGHEYYASSSIGIILLPNHENTVDELLKFADSSIQQSKRSEGNTIQFFDPVTQASLESRIQMEYWMQKALNDQYRLYFQIQVSVDGQAIGAEALIRWHHPEQGLISPAAFIPLAEKTGLILQIGQWVLETACVQLKAWEQNQNARHLILAVNVSPKQFHQSDFVKQVLAVLKHTGANPEKLKLELTESLLAEDLEDLISKMNALKAVGVKFSLDDFGTGFSSLSYLKRLPLSQLKIDQSFIRDALTDPNDAAIVRTIIALGQSLGIEVIAEGVETEEQRNFLAIHGCLHYQGYLFSRPLPIEQFEALLNHD